jgi:hypothetical protein
MPGERGACRGLSIYMVGGALRKWAWGCVELCACDCNLPRRLGTLHRVVEHHGEALPVGLHSVECSRLSRRHVSLSVRLPACLSVCQSFQMSAFDVPVWCSEWFRFCLSACLPACLSVCQYG